MPKDDPDATDPLTLTGVEVPAGRDDVRAMAVAFAEEFLAMGWDEAGLLTVFSRPAYAGPHLAWTQLGEAEVRRIVAETSQAARAFRARRTAHA